VIEHQAAARAVIFFALLGLFAGLEAWRPRRRTPRQRHLRWPPNLGLMAINTAVIFVLPVAVVGSSVWASARGWGLFNQIPLPAWSEILLAWLLLDLAIYWQHRAFHEIGWLWPLHRVHHSDVELDTTTGVRFHVGEIILSTLYKCLLVVALGAPWAAVLLFETALNGLSLFNHANLHLPERFDRILRRVLVTPDMHRAHHSVHRQEHDSNYSNAFAWWDHVFWSYTPAPRDGHEAMTIGLQQFREEHEQRLLPLLVQPAKPSS
jgi:sterol desaturase/sphingolipid hydroxylase (fatty acid hydroxylase superfamily)